MTLDAKALSGAGAVEGVAETTRHRAARLLVRPRSGPVTGKDNLRRDIQGLRALAVALVIAYHFFPGVLGGGYVGVDVFFVISGFLITLHLLKHPVRSVRDLLAFWARRIRRLLPAATLVLVATSLAGYLWLPPTVLGQLAGHVAAAGLYAENWVLAFTSTDYLAQGELPSALQHFWSLSVEEQFYIAWPVLVTLVLLVAGAVAAATRFRHGVLLGLGLLGLVSLAWSVLDTRNDPAQAYFVTTTRVWELALGGVIAAAVAAGLVPGRPRIQAAVAWAGLAMIGYAALTYDSGTPFPGYAALLPTLGAAAVILADADRAALSPAGLWRPPVVQQVGDLSYSLYLWHWPVLVIAPFALDSKLGILDKTCLVGIVVVLSVLTKCLVEDGVRFHPALVGSLRRSYLLLLACLGLSMCAAGALAFAAPDDDGSDVQALSAQPCFGAAAFREPGCAPGTGKALVPPGFAKKDKAAAYGQKCVARKPYTSRTVCHYGQDDSPLRVALLGNSHAVHWQPPLAKAAEEYGWRLDTYLETVCYPVDVPLAFPDQRLVRNCAAWNEWAIGSVVDGDYDVVVMSNRSLQALKGVHRSDKQRVAEAAYGRVLDRVVDSGARVLVIRDTPNSDVEIPDCVARHEDQPARCATPRARAIEPDPLAAAARDRQGAQIAVLDVNDRFCRGPVCHAVVGGAVTSFDHGHLTTTFALTLLPDLVEALQELHPDLTMRAREGQNRSG